MPEGGRGGFFALSVRSVVLHGILALLTVGIWLLVPAAVWAGRRGGSFTKVSYGLWGLLALITILIGAGVVTDGSDTEAVSAAPQQRPAKPKPVVASAPTPPAAPKPQPKPKPRTYLVREVIDGDTIVLANGKKVRLVQIDAPELRGTECYAPEAAATLSQLLPAGAVRVRLEFDPALDRVDRFGRQLAYVFKGRENVNLTLVLRGAASVWFFDGDEGKYASGLDAAARSAEAASRGLWGACSATVYDPFAALATRKPAPPPRPPPPAPVETEAPSNCHPSYAEACLDPSASDYDCAGGSGNGPEYTGYVRVIGPDEYGLDADDDGVGCE